MVSYGVKVAFDKLSPDIKPGMSVSAVILTNTKDNVIAVPSSSIKTNNGSKTVQVITQDQLTTQNNNPTGTIATESRDVKTGISNDTDTEILNGVSENEVVVTSVVKTGGSTSVPGSSAPSLLGGSTTNTNRGGGNGGGFTGGGGRGGN